MKILLVGAAATVLGLGGGALISGTLLKGDILERLEEEISFSAPTRTLETGDSGAGGEVIDSTAVPTSVDLSADQPPAEDDDTTGSGQEQPQLAPGGGGPSEPVASATCGDSTPESAGPGGSAMDAGPRIDPEASKKLAKIFEAMRPEDAAAVLQGMEDSEVRGILLSMDERQAAAILGDFETDRAAALSQLVLLTPPGGG